MTDITYIRTREGWLYLAVVLDLFSRQVVLVYLYPHTALRNVSRACKAIGCSRQPFYEIRRNYQTCGAAGLQDKLPDCKGPHPQSGCARN